MQSRSIFQLQAFGFLAASFGLALGLLVRVCALSADNAKSECIKGLMNNCNNAWNEIVVAAQSYPNVLYDASAARRLVHILRINQRVAK